MYIIPGIDLIDGKTVRLTKGEFDTVKQVSGDPVETAKRFRDCGAEWLHIVDLDGAKTGRPVHLRLIEKIIRSVEVKVEVGGGIRTLKTIRNYLDAGAERIVLGSAAVFDPELVYESATRFGSHIAVGIDAKDGLVRADGWTEKSSLSYIDLASSMNDAGINTLIYTDINKDGTLAGPNLEDLKTIKQKVSANLIASGGVRNIKDVQALKNMALHGVIIGKALYDGLDLREVIEAIC